MDSNLKSPPTAAACRHLVVVLGDQLDHDSAVWDDFDPARDRVWMAEVRQESEVVPSHKVRTVMFLSAMRHFAQWLVEQGYRCDYRRLTDRENTHSLPSELAAAIGRWQPEAVVMVAAGEHRVQQAIEAAVAGCQATTPTPPAEKKTSSRRKSAGASDLGAECLAKGGPRLDLRPDRHFYSDPEEFRAFAAGRKEVRLEYFYRLLRKKHDILMDGGQPLGGSWNFDQENRGSFGKRGPQGLKPTRSFLPDEITQAVMADVEACLPHLPGSLEHFDWPVTAADAELALDDFLQYRLPDFGQYQDAMWQGEPYLYHSRLSAVLNLKLLSPLTVIEATLKCFHQGRAPLNAVEGFVRQILGWREYVRGVYWTLMPEYLTRNELAATQPLPEFYWDGQTPMNCLSQTIRQTLDFGYAHHIQRLMVTGLYALLLGVDPQAVHRWYLAMYVDAVEWVELPNTLGMSQYADGGVMASKPYVASGKYIQRMSNYCTGCRFKPDERIGPTACPFTTLYWDFLAEHRERLQANQRMGFQVRNLDRIPAEELVQIRQQAAQIRRTQTARTTGEA